MNTILYNRKAFNEIHTIDKLRNIFTSLYFIFDTIMIIIYNIILLPFIYYAVEKHFNINIYFTIVIPLLLLIILISIYNTYYTNYYMPISDAKIDYKFNSAIYNKTREVDLIEFNNTNFYEKFSLLLNIGSAKLVETVNIVWWAISVILLTLAYCITILYIDPIFIVLAVSSAAIAYFINLAITEIEYSNNIESNKIARKISYYDRIYLLRKYSIDLRTSKMSFLIINRIKDIAAESKALIKNYGNKLLRLNYFKKILLLVVTTTITTLYLAFQYLVKGTTSLTVSEIIVVQTVMMQLCGILSDIAVIYPKLKQNGMYLEDYYNFMDYKPRIAENVNGVRALNKCNGLLIKNLYFQYDKDTPVLKNIYMEIKPGEKIAIVGSNGAGKTTLIKLLLRLYIPTGGCIEMDGIPAEEYQLSAYRNRFGVAYQESNLYSATVAENVLMDEYTPDKKGIVEEALKNSGISQRIAESPLGFEAIMTKEFDDNGIDLSGGQSQKLALSRVFAKDCGVVVLDEPSSALDPISEYEMYKNMMSLSVNKTFIVISHRLSITREVDKIYLMEKGEIVESGSHAELLKLNGQYARMWEVQSQSYT